MKRPKFAMPGSSYKLLHMFEIKSTSGLLLKKPLLVEFLIGKKYISLKAKMTSEIRLYIIFWEKGKTASTGVIYHFSDLIPKKYIKIIKRILKSSKFVVINSSPCLYCIMPTNRNIAWWISPDKDDYFPIKSCILNSSRKVGV